QALGGDIHDMAAFWADWGDLKPVTSATSRHVRPAMWSCQAFSARWFEPWRFMTGGMVVDFLCWGCWLGFGLGG
ncbi:hypothetical protein ACFW6U_27180, partial [Pseudomonas guariconensis]|uniref:hypothetical protein n=1 Tax=Pseudomonas guariconensis TaxID=1288410 RepID=UPI003672518E